MRVTGPAWRAVVACWLAQAACGPVPAPTVPAVPAAAATPTPPPADLDDWHVERSVGGFRFGAELRFPVRRRGAEAVQGVESDYDVTVTLRWEVRDLGNLTPGGATSGVAVVPPRGRVDLAAYAITAPAEPTASYLSFTAFLGDPAAVDDGYAYALPLAQGTRARVMQGYRGAFSHQAPTEHALDFEVPIGTTVVAMRPGTVVALNEATTTGGQDPAYEDYRFVNFVSVLHADGTVGEYLHLAPDGVLVEVGATVARGQVIASSGNTGYTTEPHLHVHVGRPGPEAERVHTVDVEFQLAPQRVGVPAGGDSVAGWE